MSRRDLAQHWLQEHDELLKSSYLPYTKRPMEETPAEYEWAPDTRGPCTGSD
jgi:hypothetical protein